MKSKIYKICQIQEWVTAKEKGFYAGSQVDSYDGFIHFSTKEQLVTTAKKHFKGQKNLILIEADAKTLPAKWEPSRDGDLFPHLYINWNLNGSEKTWQLFLDDNDNPIIPI